MGIQTTEEDSVVQENAKELLHIFSCNPTLCCMLSRFIIVDRLVNSNWTDKHLVQANSCPTII